LIANIDLAHQINPLLTVKFKTVVNLLNAGEDLSSLIERRHPQRWQTPRILLLVEASLAIRILRPLPKGIVLSIPLYR